MLNTFRTKNNSAQKVQAHILSSYWTLRWGLILIAVAFPFVLWLGGLLFFKMPLQRSMSIYYHATGRQEFLNCLPPGREKADEKKYEKCKAQFYGTGSLRNVFVGTLFGIAFVLYLYKGYSDAENGALNFAAVMAIGISLVPTNPWNGSPSSISPHGIFTILFFLAISFVAIRCAHDTLGLIGNPSTERRYRLAYIAIGIAMVAVPLLVWLLLRRGKSDIKIFVAEACSILVFAGYWFIKTLELRSTNAEQLAVNGQLEILDGKLWRVPADRLRN